MSRDRSETNVPSSNDTNQEDSEKMMNQAWTGLRRMGQPVIVGVFLGKCIVELSKKYPNSYYGLVVPSMAWPMVGLSVASSVNVGVENVDLSVRNYIYYGLIGCLAATATMSSVGTQFFFEQLNDGILKGVFTGTLVPAQGKNEFSAGLTLGLNAMVGFHTLYTVFQRHIYNFAFKTGKHA
jgi:hypothetical protein